MCICCGELMPLSRTEIVEGYSPMIDLICVMSVVSFDDDNKASSSTRSSWCLNDLEDDGSMLVLLDVSHMM